MTTVEEKLIDTNVCCGPVTRTLNNITGLFLSFVTIGIGTTQMVLATNGEKKDPIQIGLGVGVVTTGVLKLVNTIFDFCLGKKQDSITQDLQKQINIKSGLLDTKKEEIEKLEKKEKEQNGKISVLQKEQEVLKEKYDNKKTELKNLKYFNKSELGPLLNDPGVQEAIKEYKKKNKKESNNSSVSSKTSENKNNEN